MSTGGAQLRATPIFADLSPAEAETVAAACTRRSWAAGERLFEEGEVGRSVLIVTSGMAALTRRTPSGQTMQVGRCRAGEVLGEMALIDVAPRSATATAVTPLTALEMKRATFDRLLSTASPAASKILHQLSLLLSQRLRGVIDRIEEELLLSAEEDAILSEESSFRERTVRTFRPPPMPGTLQGKRAEPPPAEEGRRGELWRVLWGITR